VFHNGRDRVTLPSVDVGGTDHYDRHRPFLKVPVPVADSSRDAKGDSQSMSSQEAASSHDYSMRSGESSVTPVGIWWLAIARVNGPQEAT
jgi:hypothetical protein